MASLSVSCRKLSFGLIHPIGYVGPKPKVTAVELAEIAGASVNLVRRCAKQLRELSQGRENPRV